MKRTWENSQQNKSPKRAEDWSDADEKQLVKCLQDVEKTLHRQEHICQVCGKVFKTIAKWNRHKISHATQFACDQCDAVFSRNDNLSRHRKNRHNISTKGKKTTFDCTHCGKRMLRDCLLQKHLRQKHGIEQKQRANLIPCKYCEEIFSNYADVLRHVDMSHSSHIQRPKLQSGGRKQPSPGSSSSSPQQGIYISPAEESAPLHAAEEKESTSLHDTREETALERGLQNRHIYPRKGEKYDLLVFLANMRPEISEFLRQRVRENGGIKWSVCVQVEMERQAGDGNKITSTPYFRSNVYVLVHVDTFNTHDLDQSLQKVHSNMEKYLREGSGWYIKKVLQLDIHTVIYAPLSGSIYIPLPKSLLRARCILNIQNQDDKCFTYCVLASLHPTVENQAQAQSYVPYERELAMAGIHYPVALTQIEKFENQNKNISINVFGYEDEEIIPLRITRDPHRLHHVNLLWLKHGEITHYCLITDFNGFLSRSKTHRSRLFFCPYCLHGFTRENLLQDHLPYCSIHGAQKVELPTEGVDNQLEFKDFEKSLKVPFVIYADFETLNVKLQSCLPNSEQSSTTHMTNLEVCGFGYKVVCAEEPKFTKPTVIYRGKDASAKLIHHLLEEMTEIKSILSQVEPMLLTDQDIFETENATTCCLCKQEFTPYYKMYKKTVRHHNHLTGAFIGMTHNHCNLSAKQVTYIPVLFHNLKNFDAHILCQSIGEFKNLPIRCIAQNSERYISFSLGELRFLDSFQFLPTSLESLVNDLAQDGIDAFPHFCSEFPEREQAMLLLRKGVYPYDYMDSEDKFLETSLPVQAEFYSAIKRDGVSDEDYAHAQTVFETFQLEDLGAYHDLYLKTDVALLCDVFEAFRNVSMDQYQLDPAHYFTSPGLAWSACLKMTGVTLELMSNIDQILFIEAGIRGGVSQISHRHKKANNPYLKDYDPSQATSYLQYLDMNNLYGWAMVQKLPVDSFRFLEQREIKHFSIYDVQDDDDVGYILEVSLRYPTHLHPSHNDFPLAPESKHIPDESLSPYARRLWKKLHGKNAEDELPPRPPINKLLTTLEDKNKYILHCRNLQLYLDQGMELKEIHRILQFRQEAWMKPFIEFNTEKRKRATSTFQKNLYKLYNVSVFGKTMENVRKHKNVELVHTQRRLKKLSAKSTYKSSKIFSEDLVAVELARHKVKLCKPSYSGMSILDLSKVAMYDFYYNLLKNKYGEKMTLVLSDTDSILYHVETLDVYKDMEDDLHLYDTSDYPPGHFLHSTCNKKTLGKMKDETNGVPISEVVGLRSKMYSFLTGPIHSESIIAGLANPRSIHSSSIKEEKRAKGISKVTVKKDLRFEHYKETLFGESQRSSSMTALRSYDHNLYCDKIVKAGLSAFDDKRYLMNATHSLAYGHTLLNHGDITLIN